MALKLGRGSLTPNYRKQHHPLVNSLHITRQFHKVYENVLILSCKSHVRPQEDDGEFGQLSPTSSIIIINKASNIATSTANH